MSPLKIIALLNLHCRVHPLEGYTPSQARSPAMCDAFVDFERQGLLIEGVTLESVLDESSPFPRLTSKGLDLVTRLRGVEP